MIRTTRARSLRTVPGKLTFIRRGAEGISRDTHDQRRKGLRIASSTPPALSLSKVLNSRNSLPCALTPRTKTGMARGSRAQWRRSGFRLAAAENPLPRRIRHHNQYKGDPLGGLPQMTSIFGAVLRKAMERSCSIWRGTREETMCYYTRPSLQCSKKNRARVAGIDLKLDDRTPHVRELFELMNLDSVVEICASADAGSPPSNRRHSRLINAIDTTCAER